MNTALTDSWSLILGVSSGMGRAVAEALAAEGAHVIGVHFDTGRAAHEAETFCEQLRDQKVEAHFFNMNAASRAAREEIVGRTTELTGGAPIRILLHSLAFGSLLPFLDDGRGEPTLSSKQMSMTLDVMASSLVNWTQDLAKAQLFEHGAKIFAMTSSGAGRVLPSYGAVSAAKAALEANVRQLAVELAPQGVAVNAIRAGTTVTPALEKIPGHEAFAERCRTANPHARLTTPADVAEAVVTLSRSASPWLTGNVIGVDGGENLTA